MKGSGSPGSRRSRRPTPSSARSICPPTMSASPRRRPSRARPSPRSRASISTRSVRARGALLSGIVAALDQGAPISRSGPRAALANIVPALSPGRPATKRRARGGVDSELSCPVLVAHQMSASSAFVPCGTVGNAFALSTFRQARARRRAARAPGPLASGGCDRSCRLPRRYGSNATRDPYRGSSAGRARRTSRSAGRRNFWFSADPYPESAH